MVVGGPLCESGDIFTQPDGGVVCTRPLPVARVGDWLVIERAGAYGFAMGSNYNSKPLAAEVLIVDKNPYLVRARQTFEDSDPRREHSGLRRGPRPHQTHRNRSLGRNSQGSRLDIGLFTEIGLALDQCAKANASVRKKGVRFRDEG